MLAIACYRIGVSIQEIVWVVARSWAANPPVYGPDICVQQKMALLAWTSPGVCVCVWGELGIEVRPNPLNPPVYGPDLIACTVTCFTYGYIALP